jgi:dienelactone hydrolase
MGRMKIRNYNFGDYINANIYYPKNDQGKPVRDNLPVVIFLHAYDYARGFAYKWHSAGYPFYIQSIFEAFVDRGFAVFAFDMIGFGTRVQEGTLFYERYPHWSKLGKMVADVKAALDLSVNLDFVDKERIYTFGYTLGGTVGLYAAALDERIKGVISICGFTPMRLSGKEKGIEGIQAYSHLHGLLPKLGFFVGYEKRTPYDFHEILAAIAPRPVLIIAPQLDKEAPFQDVKQCVEEVRKVYQLHNKNSSLDFYTPNDYNRFSLQMRQKMFNWIDVTLK